jgi:hypothetical protein
VASCVNAAAQSEYARLSGKPVAALRQAMETWLPIAIVRYFLLMGGPRVAAYLPPTEPRSR